MYSCYGLSDTRRTLYVKMPYGLANSLKVYQRILNDTLRGHLNERNVLVNVDDDLLLSDS